MRPPPSSTLFPYTTLFRSSPARLSTSRTTSRCNLSLRNVPSYVSVPLPYLRSEEHTSELQSRPHLVCRLLLEKTKQTRLGPPRRPPTDANSRPAPPTLGPR